MKVYSNNGMTFLLIVGNIRFIPFRCEMISSENLNRKHSEVGGKLVEKPEGRRPLRRPRRSWVGNIKMDIVVWTGLV
jgi:hypothetical protein